MAPRDDEYDAFIKMVFEFAKTIDGHEEKRSMMMRNMLDKKGWWLKKAVKHFNAERAARGQAPLFKNFHNMNKEAIATMIVDCLLNC